MKNSKNYIWMALFACLFMACEEVKFGDEFLAKPPSGDVTIDTVYSNIVYAEQALWNTYATLPYRINRNWNAKGNVMGMDIMESITDLVQSHLAWGGAAKYYGGQYDAGSENSGTWTKYHFTQEDSWTGIRKAYLFIENIDGVPDVSEDYIRRLKAEAKLIIAIHYSDMFRHYGGLPWIDSSVSPSDDFNKQRLTAKETLDNIIDLIDEAIADLPWELESNDNWEGRMHRAGAMGLKARMLLFGASPLFNDDVPYLAGDASSQKMTWFGEKDPQLWVEARDAAKALIDELQLRGVYSMVNTGNPRQDFQDGYYKRGLHEVLIPVHAGYKTGDYWSQNYYFYQSAGGYGTNCWTQNYVDMFPMKNGGAIYDANGNPANGYDPNDPYKDRDPRLYETILTNGDEYLGRTAEIWIGGRERKNVTSKGRITGYGARKFWLDGDASTSVKSITHWPYLRLPEIYLSYAEAINEIEGGPTAEAYEYVNKVRSRVGVGVLEEGLNQQEFREALLRERACEFGLEEVRWFDLIRWKREQDFTKTLHGMDIKSGDGAGGQLTYNVTDQPERFWKKEWSPKWYLSAFPPDEVNKDYGLVQNPGW
ncbi:RagB/SusD family nutrient uptake outer membrane protein [Saccharicrinis fermentans]|uniref:RagB/SusD family nutrient uptake outer membrane protein n=1 Tax=Saccharicrinis fermentans TaxID=982 RepID=UPI0004886885|nr:RagB/SusD family nutrient uptake outer membrane protein [Saccharicrinis fermentans]